MKWKAARRSLSSMILLFGLALILAGSYQITTFAESRDSAEFYLSNGPPCLFWGCVLVLLGWPLRWRTRDTNTHRPRAR
jgi:hypothetical protein